MRQNSELKIVQMPEWPKMRKLFNCLLLAFLMMLTGCNTEQSSLEELRVAATTSTRDSGLLDLLLPSFEEEYDARVDLIAVGTGAALRLGMEGEVDVVICHSQKDELRFMSEGHGVRREPLMHNYFVLVGPASDPAGVKGQAIHVALEGIARKNEAFVSRGDKSGTHQRELATWADCTQTKSLDGFLNSKRYIKTGQGMGATLMIANEKQAYTLVDEGTWYKRRGSVDLEVLVENDDELKNHYSVILVDPKKHDSINGSLAEKFFDFLMDAKTQRRIDEYKVDGEQLFRADRLSRKPETTESNSAKDCVE